MQNRISSKKTGPRLLLILALLAVFAFTAMTLGAAPEAGGSDSIDGTAAEPSAAVDRSYIVLMELAPALVYDGEIPGLKATKAAEGAGFDASSAAAEEYAAYSIAAQDDVLAATGVSQRSVTNRYTTTLNGFSALMSEAQAKVMSRQDGVKLVMKDQWRQPLGERIVTGTVTVSPAGDAWQTGLTGEDVIVGVIDGGIWPEHPSFADDGSYSDLGITVEDTAENPACDFGNLAHNENDWPFTCNNKLLVARQMLPTYRALIGAEPYEFDSARDEGGHGTHTASTAAGNANVPASIFNQDRGLVSGVAPRARIMAYKGLGALGGFTSDLTAAIDQAVADGVDVINYSVGGGAGAPGTDEIAFLMAEDAGVHVATSAGNSGPTPATVGSPGVSPWMTTVAASTQHLRYEGVIVLSDGRSYSGVSITPGIEGKELVDAAVAGGDLCIPGTLDAALVEDKIVLCRRGEIARAAKSRAVYMAGGAGMIMYENSDAGDLMSDNHWVPSSHIDYTPGLEIKAFIAGQPFGYNVYTPAVVGDGSGTAAPMDAKPVPMAEIIGLGTSDFTPAPTITSFSSRGPNAFAADIIKPDITAPGIQILAGNSPAYDGDPNKVTGELFQAIAGTSMSSPQVAGLFALYVERFPVDPPSWSKSALMTTSSQDVRDSDRVSMADPFDMGAGHAAPGHAQDAGSMFQPGLVYYANRLDYFGYLCDVYPDVFTNAAATCATLDGLGVPIKATGLNVPSIGIANLAGSQTVTRTVTSAALTTGVVTYTVSVDAPVGFTVDIEPETIALDALESASYAVTFSNESAPLGEWAYGSLTWTDESGMVDVYSPIAVNPSLFGYPPSVATTGAAASGMFDVSFGYTGSYEAAPHGMIAATITSDNVVQDPDQEFDPDDGYSNKHDFEVSDAAYLRFAIPPEGTEADADLDMFLYDPTGELVASSTAGGTNELINITLPMDGTWSLYVHGWSTPGGDSDYDLYSWIIPAAPGGSLAIDAQPESAVLAEMGAVEYSWEGLMDEWYLGAISHSGAPEGEESGLLGLTLINADNRP